MTGGSSVFIQVGIETPTIEVRVPAPDVKNVVVPTGAPLWVQAAFNIEQAANQFTRAGLDRDQDLCDAQAVVLGAATWSNDTHTDRSRRSGERCRVLIRRGSGRHR